MIKTNSNDRNQLVLRYPASWKANKWREALPSGNGKIGASVYGGVKEETILLNHEGLWSGGKKAELPDVSYTLAEVRKLMDEGSYHIANHLLADELKAQEYAPMIPAPLPLADLLISMDIQSGFKHYRRMLNMETGEVTVRWNDNDQTYRRELFVSRANDTVVYQISADHGEINAKLRLALHHPGDSINPLPSPELQNHSASRASEQYLYFATQNDDGTDFGALTRVIAIQGDLSCEGDTIAVKGAERILVLTKLFVKGSREADWSRLKDELAAVSGNYEDLLAPHVNLHARLFNSASIELSDDDGGESGNEQLLVEAYDGETPVRLVEKMWAFGRYLFISSTSEDGSPCPLYGLWGGDYQPIFSQNVANVNIEMIYWHAPSGGLVSHLKSIIVYLDSMLDQFKDNARKLFGTRGIYISAYTAPDYGFPCINVPVILNWTGGAGWLAQHCYAYYQFTGDEALLRSSILPFMREAALFYEDFFVVGSDGYIVVYPSVSPENSPGNFPDSEANQLDHPMPTTVNATMEFAIAKELLCHLIEGSRSLQMYEDEIGKWEELLRRIPPYQINEEGALKEWMHDDFTDNYNHRHMSHLYPFFPGVEITAEKHPEWYDASAVAMDKRLVVGLGDQSGWSLMYLGNLYARLGDGERAHECLDLVARSCLMNNFFTTHNDWRDMGICLNFDLAPFQIDANMGWVSVVQEMLLFVSADLIKLLPALPPAWKKGRYNGLRFHTGHAECTWDSVSGEFEASLYAERDTNVTVKLPEAWRHAAAYVGQAHVHQSPLGESYREIRMKAGSCVVFAM